MPSSSPTTACFISQCNTDVRYTDDVGSSYPVNEALGANPGVRNANRAIFLAF
ncbi:uncharacterized protein TrAFT101_007577 [Trichoderma asperellum]|uniref:uncharacterized protein n=1 Tax=Trichoderma asperellum TaxID=101201 RepID=UPI0033317AAB|nr:hypothetical protein TrAFT101_007577 [Trichoderma asperellum]